MLLVLVVVLHAISGRERDFVEWRRGELNALTLLSVCCAQKLLVDISRVRESFNPRFSAKVRCRTKPKLDPGRHPCSRSMWGSGPVDGYPLLGGTNDASRLRKVFIKP